MKLHFSEKEWSLEHQGSVLLRSSEAFPFLFAGIGQETVDMYRGNFKIEDYVTERRPLAVTAVLPLPDGLSVEYGDDLSLRITLDGDCAGLAFTQKNPDINRLWLRVSAEPDECCWGCGEQMSYFNLRGRHFPLWTSEPGVGRDKSTYVTWRSDVENKAGGDYYNTNFPQPTFVSSRHYYLHADTTAYADFDFRHPTCMPTPRLMPTLTSAIRNSMNFSSGRFRPPSGSKRRTVFRNCSPKRAPSSAASRNCRTGSTTA